MKSRVEPKTFREKTAKCFWFEKSLPRRVVRTRRRQEWQPGLRTCTTAQAAALPDRLTEQLGLIGNWAGVGSASRKFCSYVTIASPGNGARAVIRALHG
jgi:hypothetical protein